jgi:hypothetical protein
MPNYVDCDLIVKGEPDVLDGFRNWLMSLEADETDRNLGYKISDALIPYPQRFKDQTIIAKEAEKNKTGYVPDGFNSGGYEWCLTNWGTKWGLYDWKFKEFHKNELIYTFQSAWSPATPLILAMGKKFPELRFDLAYFECGMGFQGKYVIMNGEVAEESQSKYEGERGG